MHYLCFYKDCALMLLFLLFFSSSSVALYKCTHKFVFALKLLYIVIEMTLFHWSMTWPDICVISSTKLTGRRVLMHEGANNDEFWFNSRRLTLKRTINHQTLFQFMLFAIHLYDRSKEGSLCKFCGQITKQFLTNNYQTIKPHHFLFVFWFFMEFN